MDDNALVELVGMILCNAVILNAIIEMLGVICRLRKKNGKISRVQIRGATLRGKLK